MSASRSQAKLLRPPVDLSPETAEDSVMNRRSKAYVEGERESTNHPDGLEPVNDTRKRKRASVDSYMDNLTRNEEGLFICPFSQPRNRVRYVCKEPARKTKQAIRKHLGDIQAVGYDGLHRAQDPLWKNDSVEAYLRKGRLVLSEEELKRRKQQRNANYYARKREKKKEIMSQLNEGKISESEAGKQIAELNLNLGWFRTAAETNGLLNDYNTLLDYFTIFYGCQDRPTVNRIPCQWPTEPSEDSYINLAILLIPLPSLLKINNPLDPKVVEALKTLLHPQFKHLSEWLDDDEKTRLLPILNGSISTVEEKYSNESEQATFSKRWEDAKNKAVLEITPISTSVPGFVWRRALDFAFASLSGTVRTEGRSFTPSGISDSSASLGTETEG